jgi:hypothetical protein
MNLQSGRASGKLVMGAMPIRAMVDWALDYWRRGWSVIPLKTGQKIPLIPWEEYEHRLPDEAEIRSWFECRPEANLAAVTGRVSGLIVLDADPRHHGDESIQALERTHGSLPVTVEALTGGGGRHFYFQLADGTLRTQVGLAPGLDVRGEGGLVVVPPSLHPSGRRYAWREGRAPGEIALAVVPDWIITQSSTEIARGGHPLHYWRELVGAGVEQGERNSTIASLTGHLLWRGVDVDVALELLLCWNRVRCYPPLPDEEVERTVASIARTHTVTRLRSERGHAKE